ncbi:SEC-C domain-containing protein, partial [Singulisphaera rosea]
MAAVDPYSSCPCGSGQKFKWCCQKVEALADRAQRLFDNGQAEAAIETLDEGLKKELDNPWLLTRKALYLIRQQAPDPAKDALRLVLRKIPAHLGASILLTRLVLETEGGEAGAAQFQQTITALPVNER